jgi:transcriptional regulator with XRE-family HTH domain
MKIKDTSVCLRLGEERKRLRLNQGKVATYCEVSIKSVGRWEKNIPIPADKLALLAQLGYDINYILTGVKPLPEVAGLDAVAQVWNTDHADKTSKNQEAWLGVLGNLAGNDTEHLKRIGLALIAYSQAKTKKPS